MDIGATVCRPGRPSADVPGAAVVPLRRGERDGGAERRRRGRATARRAHRPPPAFRLDQPLAARPHRSTGSARSTATRWSPSRRPIGDHDAAAVDRAPSTAWRATASSSSTRRRAPGPARDRLTPPTRWPATLRRRCPPTVDPRRRPSPARRRPVDLRDWTCAGCGRAGRRQAALPPIAAEAMTGADRRAQALGYPERAADGARRDGRRRGGPGARHGPRPLGDRPDRRSCAVPATTAATGSWPPAGSRSPAPRSSSPSSPPDARPRRRVGGPQLGPHRARRAGSSRSTCRRPRRRDVRARDRQGRGRRRRPARDRRPAAPLREPIRSAVELISRARAGGRPGRRRRHADRGRPLERRAVRSGGPCRPHRHLPPAEDRAC